MEKKDELEEVKHFEKLKREMEEFEEGFPDGVYVAPSSRNEPIIKLKEMYKYCRERGIDLKDLTKEELERFLVYLKEDENI